MLDGLQGRLPSSRLPGSSETDLEGFCRGHGGSPWFASGQPIQKTWTWEGDKDLTPQRMPLRRLLLARVPVLAIHSPYWPFTVRTLLPRALTPILPSTYPWRRFPCLKGSFNPPHLPHSQPSEARATPFPFSYPFSVGFHTESFFPFSTFSFISL